MKNITTKTNRSCPAAYNHSADYTIFCQEKPSGANAGGGAKNPRCCNAVNTRTFERYIEVQANLESKNFAIVSPRIAGTIEKFFVDEGNTVIANETKLFSYRFSKPSANGRNSEKSAGCSNVSQNNRLLQILKKHKPISKRQNSTITASKDYMKKRLLPLTILNNNNPDINNSKPL